MNVIRKNSLAAAGMVAILAGSLVMIGWMLDIALLKSVFPDFISMKFNTAICFFFTGLAMVMIEKKQGGRNCKVCLAVVLLISILTLFEYLFTVNIGIDELLWKEGPGTPYTIYPGRPSALTAINFILLSIVLFNLNSQKKYIHTWLALSLCMLIASFSAISYFFGNPELISIPSLTVIALHTALLFIIICLGIFYNDLFTQTIHSFQHRIVAGFLIIAFMLLVVVYLDYKADKGLQGKPTDISNNLESLTIADNIISTVSRMEAGIHKFLLTGDSTLLGSLGKDRREITNDLRQLEILIAAHPYQRSRLDSLSGLLATNFTLLDSIMGFRGKIHPGNTASGNIILRTELIMSRSIFIVSELKKSENELLLQKQTAINSNKTTSNQLILFLGFCILAIFLLLIQFIFRNTNARIRAEEEARGLAKTLEKKVAERTDQLNTVNRQLQKLTEYLQQTKEDERRQLAREVNDEIGQLASVVKMDIDWLALHITDTDPNLHKHLTHASTVLHTLIEEVRKLASSLRPVMIDELGLNASIKWLCDQFTRTSTIPCVFTEEMDDKEIPQQTRTELFRICQESLTNVAKHAKASQVMVRLWKINDSIELSITDNGNGFDASHNADRMGLIGIRERALSVDGKLEIEAGEGEGTTVRVRIPVTR